MLDTDLENTSIQVMSDYLGCGGGHITQEKQSSNKRESKTLPKPPGRGKNSNQCHWGKKLPFQMLKRLTFVPESFNGKAEGQGLT